MVCNCGNVKVVLAEFCPINVPPIKYWVVVHCVQPVALPELLQTATKVDWVVDVDMVDL